MMDLVTVGSGGSVMRTRVVAVGRFDSTPIRRLASQARKEGRLIDLTYGKACKLVLFLDSGHIVLASKFDLFQEESEMRE